MVTIGYKNETFCRTTNTVKILMSDGFVSVGIKDHKGLPWLNFNSKVVNITIEYTEGVTKLIFTEGFFNEEFKGLLRKVSTDENIIL